MEIKREQLWIVTILVHVKTGAIIGLSVKARMGIGERNEGNDGNKGNHGGNDENAGDQSGNAGNRGGSVEN